MSGWDLAVPQGAQDPQRGPREASVFINCPYDPGYKEVFEAILLTLLCYGMWPRWADDGSRTDPRLARIAYPLRGSLYSIHDLSRCKGEGDENLARMNMPLELGMALEQAYDPHNEPHRDHKCVVLVSSTSSYRQAVSDLNAFDLMPYDGSPAELVSQLGNFLKVTARRADAPPVLSIQRALKAWSGLLDRQRRQNGGHAPTWAETVACWYELAGKRWSTRWPPPA